jgi:hydrogenase expression/formation protein HypC
MCLGVPGRIESLERAPSGMAMGRVSFGGISKTVCLALVPGATVGDYVVVHVGFAITRVDEAEARETLAYLARVGGLEELEAPDPE